MMLGPAAFGQPGRAPRPRPLLRHIVGDVLRRTRLGQGRTLADVASAARVSMPYLSELERGRKEASSEILAAICDALHIELSDLLARVGSDLARERARKASALRLGASDAMTTGSSRPQVPRALAGAAPVQPEDLPAEAADRGAAPADLPVDVVRLLGDPGDITGSLDSTPRACSTDYRSSGDARCLVAA